MVAAGAGVVLTAAVAILVAGFFGADSAHPPGLPNLRPQQEVVTVSQPPPAPARTAAPAATGGTRSSPAPSPSSTLDMRGNRPTRLPNHPQPTKTK